MMAASFEFRPVSTLLTAVMLALLLWLGTWQLSRAQGKRELLARFDQSAVVMRWDDVDEVPPRYTPVSVTGVYLAHRQVLLEGISHNGQPGVEVLTPLRLASGGVIMVNRGWTPWRGTRDAPATPAAPDGTVKVTGRARPFAQPGLRLGDGNGSIAQTWPRLAIYPGRDEIAQWLGQDVARAQVLLDASEPGGFMRQWRPDAFPPSRHVGYAVQWYGLALALVVLFLVASRKSKVEETHGERGQR
jgi:surfeit locus 1 family protein